MKLAEYIEHMGVPAACKLFGKSVHTVRSWRYGTRVPKLETAYELIDAAGGKLTLESIYPRDTKPDGRAHPRKR